MAFMNLNGFINSTMLAMSDGRGINELLNLLQSDPEAVSTLTGSEKALLILFVAGLGMAVTFAVLLFLWFSITVLTKVLNKTHSKTSKPSKVEEVETSVAELVEEEDEELIAVIAAAIAASMNTSIHNIVVKNIVQVNDHSPSWAKTGRIEQMNTRF